VSGIALPPNQARELEQDAIIILHELDYSKLAGDPGNPDFLYPFTDAANSNSQTLQHNGRSYFPMPLQFKGVRITTQGQQARPSLTVAEVVMGAFHSLVIPLRDLRGARLTRKRIYRRHLDDGSQPDVSAVFWPPEEWVVSRKIRASRALLEFELTSKVDFDQIDLPTGRLEHGWCPFVYGPNREAADPPLCSWTHDVVSPPSSGPYFDAQNVEVFTPAEDNCSLDYQGCYLRFHARNLPLDFGGFPAIRRLTQRNNIS